MRTIPGNFFMTSRIVFVLGLLAALSGFVTPPLALALGLAFGLLFAHPYPKQSTKFSKYLLQLAVIGLGFGMNLHEVVRAGRSGFVYTLLGISFALIAGMLLGRFLQVPKISAYLISTGTAICGGSAIAVGGPMPVALGDGLAGSVGAVV